MMSQILLILIDFIQNHTFFVPFFRSFFKSLDLNSSRTNNDNKITVIFLTLKGLSDKTIKVFMSFAL